MRSNPKDATVIHGWDSEIGLALWKRGTAFLSHLSRRSALDNHGCVYAHMLHCPVELHEHHFKNIL